MAASDTIIIAGAAHAGGRVAQSVRANGFEGRVLLIGAEAYPPYERPPLSKQLLTTGEGMERVQLHEPAYYPEHDIELRLGTTITAIDPASRQVRFDGSVESYDRLVLAMGARVRRLQAPGVDLPGVVYLRDYDESRAIKAELKPGKRVTVIGGGFIGLEVAASARTSGCEVTVIELIDRLMGRAVAPEIGEYYAALHKSHGVDVRLGVGVERLEGAGRVERVVCADGGIVETDMVIVGIGIVPNVELAAEAGLEIDNGVVVDEFGRTSDPHIYAAGDLANQPSAFLGRRIRLESYQNAQDQGMTIGRNVVGEPQPYNDRLWFWTDQYDVNLQMLGSPSAWDRLVWRGDVASGRFTVFYLQGGAIVAVNTVNNGREVRLAERLMASRAQYDPDQLADPEVNLRKLTPG